nr:hypothetical protein [Halomicronema hongdechloris]
MADPAGSTKRPSGPDPTDGLPPLLAQVLIQRHLETPDQVLEFLDPKPSNSPPL